LPARRDFVEQGTALEAPKVSETLYRSIVEMLPNAIVIIQPDGSITAANSQTLDLFGLKSLSDFLGRNVFDFILPEERDRVESDLGRVAMSEKLHNQEYRLLRKDRTPFWAEVSGYLIPGTGEKPKGILVTARDISKRKSMEENLRNLSVTDELTGLYNRRGFSLAAEQELKHAHRTKADLILLFYDMDKLKAINDNYGHAEGDEALKAAAAALRSTFRASDIIARWGGDEFTVLALDVPKGSISVLQHRFDETLERLNGAMGMRYHISFSVGMARCDFEHPLMLQEMLRIADAAMYRKKLGKRIR